MINSFTDIRFTLPWKLILVLSKGAMVVLAKAPAQAPANSDVKTALRREEPCNTYDLAKRFSVYFLQPVLNQPR